MSEFKIVIVGAGIGGLACAIALRGEGRDITIVEKSRLLRETGAGISLQPNASRIVNMWGIAEGLAHNGAFADRGFAIYTTEGKLLNKMPFKKEDDGAARIIYHRIDLHNGLKRLATSEERDGKPAKLILGNAVVSCDCEGGKLELQDGTTLDADLIIGADGIKSVMRDTVVGQNIEAKPTGLSAYRLLVPSAALKDIPEATQIMDLDDPYTTMIIGQDRRILMGPVRGGEDLTIVALVPDEKMNEDSSTTSWTSEGNIEDVLKSYEDFPSWCKEIFKLSPSIGLWQLRDIDPLPTWVKGRALIIGDAAHAMLPLQGQGASQTFEDCEALAAVFEGVKSKPSAGDVNERLQRVFKGRYERASTVQQYSRAQAKTKQTAGAPAAAILNPMEFYSYCVGYSGYNDWIKRTEVKAN